MKYDQVKEMVSLFNQSTNQEMKLETEEVSLYLNKQPQGAKEATTAAKMTATEESVNETPTEPSLVSTVTTEIESPMVGSVYLQPAPDQAAYVSIGQTVAVGDVVCVIEAMKMMTEVKSQVAGVISAVLVDNEELVEYQQPLFKVKEG